VSKDEELDYLQHVTSRDFVDFGFEPEFIGRLPVHVICQDLPPDDLYQILKHSKGSIIAQYEGAFRAYNIETMFSDEALRRIAELAYEERTGARALMTVCERVLREYKFELPSSGVQRFVVTSEVVDAPMEELQKLLKTPGYNQKLIAREQVKRYEKDFLEKHGITVEFDEEAIELIAERAADGGINAKEICKETLKSYEHGINLIKKNTGKTKFAITQEVIENPDKVLESWIRESYSKMSEQVA